ncbi:MAG TPA: FAD-dependent oxidoreductase [Vicinamibacteria bacterium]
MKRDLAALAAREWDVVVVGGGIHGAAVAWDAAQRGLAVALVEREDFGAGASWNSLKTIHGGLRHLQRLDVFGLRESSLERRTLLAIAPQLVTTLRFLVPCAGHAARSRAAFAAVLLVNDLLTRDRNHGLPEARQIPRGRTLSAAEALALVPGLPARGLTGAAVWHDAQVSSSERLLLGFLHAAADAGAVVANHAEALELLRAGSGRVAGIALRDALTGRTLEARARLVVNAAGPWLDELTRSLGPRRAPLPLLRARNIVLRRPPPVPLAVGARSGGRFLFLVPWQGRSIVGTSYEPSLAPPSDPRAFLDEAARAFPWAGIERDDLALVHEGLVPGSPHELWTRSRVVDHERVDGTHGLLSLLAVKFTTARAVAERAVDLALERLGRPRAACRTALTPLPNACPLAGGLAERARAAVRDEMALSLADAVLRRLDLGTAGAPAPDELAVVSETMARELGWDAARERAERAAVAVFFAARGSPIRLLE